MLYKPQERPKEAFIITTAIVIIGIFGGLFIDKIIPFIALLFWLQYTTVLSYMQWKRKSVHDYGSLTNILLHPDIRFILFFLLAIFAIFNVYYGNILLSYGILVIWWLFNYNFYIYYSKIPKKDNKR